MCMYIYVCVWWGGCGYKNNCFIVNQRPNDSVTNIESFEVIFFQYKIWITVCLSNKLRCEFFSKKDNSLMPPMEVVKCIFFQTGWQSNPFFTVYKNKLF